MSLQTYKSCADEAVQAFHRGDHRLSATKYWQAFLASPDKWEPNRWQIFHGFTSILQEEYFEASQHDLDNLQSVILDTKEVKLYRCEAAFTSGLLSRIRNERDDAADFYRDAIRLADKTSKKERKWTVLATFTTPDGNHVAGIGQKPVGDIIDEIRKQAHDNLQQMEKPNLYNMANGPPTLSNDIQRLRSDGTPLPPLQRNTGIQIGPMDTELTKEMIDRMLAVGGDKCDFCLQTRKEVGRKLLLQCSRCKKAYYCSAECQKKQWKAGHKKYCRKAGDVKPGDYVRLQGIEAKPEINGLMVQIINPDPNKEGRWEVKIPGGDTSLSIATSKMEQLRPLE